MSGQENKFTENTQETPVVNESAAWAGEEVNRAAKPAKKSKKKRTWLKVIIWIIVIALVIYLTMLLAVGISEELDTIPDLINYIRDQFR